MSSGWGLVNSEVPQEGNVAMLRNARPDALGDVGRKLLRELAQDCRSAGGGGAVDALIIDPNAGSGVGKGAQHQGGCSGAF